MSFTLPALPLIQINQVNEGREYNKQQCDDCALIAEKQTVVKSSHPGPVLTRLKMATTRSLSDDVYYSYITHTHHL